MTGKVLFLSLFLLSHQSKGTCFISLFLLLSQLIQFIEFCVLLELEGIKHKLTYFSSRISAK